MKKNFIIFALLTAILFLPQTTNAVELLTNGSFETGDFTGWTTEMTQSSPWCSNWVVATSSNSCLAGVTPQDGARVAFNGFDGTGGEFRLYQDVTVPAGMSSRLTFMYRIRWNIPSATNQARIFHVQIRNPTTNNVLETVHTFTASSGQSNQDSGWITEQILLPNYAGQNIRLYFLEIIPQSFTGPGQFELDAVQFEAFAPTAASLDINGRVLDFQGGGISRAFVSITDSSGQRRTTMTNPFGFYNFTEIEVGDTYIFEVYHKRYFFPESPRVIQVTDKIDSVVFRASP